MTFIEFLTRRYPSLFFLIILFRHNIILTPEKDIKHYFNYPRYPKGTSICRENE